MKLYNLKNAKFFSILVLIAIMCWFLHKQDQYYKGRLAILEKDMIVVREVLGEEEFNIRYELWSVTLKDTGESDDNKEGDSTSHD